MKATMIFVPLIFIFSLPAFVMNAPNPYALNNLYSEARNLTIEKNDEGFTINNNDQNIYCLSLKTDKLSLKKGSYKISFNLKTNTITKKLQAQIKGSGSSNHLIKSKTKDISLDDSLVQMSFTLSEDQELKLFIHFGVEPSFKNWQLTNLSLRKD